MDRRRSVRLVSLSVLLLALTGSAAADRWPGQWQVNGNGVTGILEFSVGENGTLAGQLFGEAIEGHITGRHVVIRRAADGGDRSEVWEGWFGQPSGEESDLIVAGTITVSDGERTTLFPWFGTQGASTSASREAAAAVPAPPLPADPPAEVVPAAGGFSGRWSATEGTVEIVQDGKQLTVVLPDGSSCAGRLTGGDTLIVGLRKGCCNGKLDGPDAISWSDGSRWRRTD